MNRTHLLKRVLGDCYCRLQPSNIHGIGVFAIRDIPKGRNPLKTLKKYALVGYVRITEGELNALPPKLSELIRALFVPSDGKLHVPTYGMNVIYLNTYLNHSTKPNLRTSDGFNFISLKKILIGEELTVDYRTYGAEVQNAMSPQ